MTRPSFLFAGLLAVCFSTTALAGVDPDGTLRADLPALSGPDFELSADAGVQSGNTLFFSLSELHLGSSESLTITGSESIEQVVIRVTGGVASVVGGPLAMGISDADLYLVNPAGVDLVASARTTLPGFIVGSWDDLVFDDETFHSAPGDDDPLPAGDPVSLSFGDDSNGSLTITGDTRSTGTLIAAGGDLDFDGVSFDGLEATAIVSVASAGSFDLATHEATFTAYGSLDLRNDAQINCASLFERMTLRAGEMTLDDGAIRRQAGAGAEEVGLAIDAGTLTVGGGSLITAENANDTARGRQIVIDADSIVVRGTISSVTESNAGSVTLRAPSIQVYGMVRSFGTDDYNGGDVTLEGETVLIDGGVVKSDSATTGKAGTITLSGDHITLTNAAAVRTHGREGEIDLLGGSVRIDGSATVDTETGVNGQETTITISGTDLTIADDSFVSTSASIGLGGHIDIDVDTLSMVDISSLVVLGRGGTITVEATTVELAGATIGTGTGPGEGTLGAITVSASESITLSGGAEISSRPTCCETSGEVILLAPLVTINASKVTVRSDNGSGGDIMIQATDLVLDNGAVISTLNGNPNGATNVEIILSGTLTSQGFNDNTIDTRNQEVGDGGDIHIMASGLSLETPLVLRTEAEVGEDGRINPDTRGRTILAIESFEGEGGDCTAGGTLIATGRDNGAPIPGDGSLSEDEITESHWICKGSIGQDGEDGPSPLLEVSEETGDDCDNGGYLL